MGGYKNFYYVWIYQAKQNNKLTPYYYVVKNPQYLLLSEYF